MISVPIPPPPSGWLLSKLLSFPSSPVSVFTTVIFLLTCTIPSTTQTKNLKGKRSVQHLSRTAILQTNSTPHWLACLSDTSSVITPLLSIHSGIQQSPSPHHYQPHQTNNNHHHHHPPIPHQNSKSPQNVTLLPRKRTTSTTTPVHHLRRSRRRPHQPPPPIHPGPYLPHQHHPRRGSPPSHLRVEAHHARPCSKLQPRGTQACHDVGQRHLVCCWVGGSGRFYGTGLKGLEGGKEGGERKGGGGGSELPMKKIGLSLRFREIFLTMAEEKG